MAEKKKKKFGVIAGCGRLGSFLANKLSSSGYGITVVDNQQEAFKNLSLEFSGYQILGDIIELRTMKKAGMGMAKFFISTTGGDNTNIMAAQVAKEMFKVNQVVARVNEPKKKMIYTEMGIKSVCPTEISAEVFLEELSFQKDKALLKDWL